MPFTPVVSVQNGNVRNAKGTLERNIRATSGEMTVRASCQSRADGAQGNGAPFDPETQGGGI